MDLRERKEFEARVPEIAAAVEKKPVGWINPRLVSMKELPKDLAVTVEDIDDAEARLERFAPYIMKQFPETEKDGGLIESPFVEIPKMKELLKERHGCELAGRLYLKEDSQLVIAGSIKARGGIYEILKYAETLAIENGLLKTTDDYSILASQEFVDFFGRYTIQVGSTGNLGLSIGIISAKLGFKVIVHMSHDARQWKKDLLRSKGVTVKEYESDYGEAVKQCKYYEVVYILFHTGMRISEFCGLTLKDIDLENRTVNIDHQLQRTSDMRYIIETTKTDAGTRVLPITEDVAQMFQAIIEDRNAPKVEKSIDGYSGFLFYDDNGMPLVAMHWQHRFNHMVGRYNDIYRVQMPNITPHVCRHTYCSNMAKSGMNPKTLQYLMGHSDISVTMNVYTHIGFDDAEEELKRMEEFRKAQGEVEQKKEKPMSQKMFKVV